MTLQLDQCVNLLYQLVNCVEKQRGKLRNTDVAADYVFLCISLCPESHSTVIFLLIFLGNTAFVGNVERNIFYIKFENSNNLHYNTCIPN